MDIDLIMHGVHRAGSSAPPGTAAYASLASFSRVAKVGRRSESSQSTGRTASGTVLGTVHARSNPPAYNLCRAALPEDRRVLAISVQFTHRVRSKALSRCQTLRLPVTFAGLRVGVVMQRRDFIGLVSGAAACPLVVLAQQAVRVRRIGVLMAYAEIDPEARARVAALEKELHDLGWTEGRDIQIDTRWPTANLETIDRTAHELVASQPDVILSSTTLTTEALLRYTRVIPIVFATVADPVGSGFVATMSRPGRNATGFTNIEGSMAGKWLELLKQVAPRLSRVALLYNLPTAPFSEIFLDPFKAAAVALGVEAIVTPVVNSSELESAFASLASAPGGGLIFTPGPFMSTRSAQLTALAARHRLPTVFPFRYYAELGGLLAYGNDQSDNYRRAGAYVDRILRGEKVSELPVQNPTKFELTINLKTAKALNLSVPPFLLAQADHVIE